jgi:iron complex outermembrane receptor protein
VKPESLFDIELGGAVRTTQLSVSANLYWMEFKDEIVKSGQVDRFGQPITGNADRTRHVGIEVSASATIAPSFDFSANVTLSRNRFVHHDDYSTGSAVSFNDNPIAGFPDILFNARLTYRIGKGSVSLSGRYVGKQYTDNFKNEENTVDPYFVSDAWLGYTFVGVFSNVDVEMKIQANNIFDKLYAAYGEGPAFFVVAERNVFFNVAVNL